MMGSELGKTDGTILSNLKDANIQWVRRNGILWSQVEAEEGARNWNAITNFEKSLQLTASQGINTILVVRSTPSWAQKVPGYLCGPVKEDKLNAFAKFMGDAVKRYSVPPYNIKYWELGNEPDVDPSIVPSESPFGCWGNAADPYYGGEYYAEMLKVAYPAIKAADPEAKVLIGGLLLDCDPDHPPEGKNCTPALFLKGILKNGGGDYFDMISFHGYNLYYGTLDLDEHHPNWLYRGGVVVGKINYIRDLLKSYGLEKPLIDTEGSLLCPENATGYCSPPDAKFYDLQADYLVWLFVRNWAYGISGTIWYNFDGPGWRYGSLLDQDQKPRPAYKAFQFLTRELDQASYNGTLSQYPNLRAYAFSSPGKEIWVLWSPDGNDYSINLPAGVVHVYNKYGEEQPINGNELKVNSPIYIEFSP